MGEEKVGDKIVEFLKKNTGTKYSAKELARQIDEINNYTWVIKKCVSMARQGTIQLEEAVIVSSQGTKVLSKQVWV